MTGCQELGRLERQSHWALQLGLARCCRALPPAHETFVETQPLVSRGCVCSFSTAVCLAQYQALHAHACIMSGCEQAGGEAKSLQVRLWDPPQRVERHLPIWEGTPDFRLARGQVQTPAMPQTANVEHAPTAPTLRESPWAGESALLPDAQTSLSIWLKGMTSLLKILGFLLCRHTLLQQGTCTQVAGISPSGISLSEVAWGCAVRGRALKLTAASELG